MLFFSLLSWAWGKGNKRNPDDVGGKILFDEMKRSKKCEELGKKKTTTKGSNTKNTNSSWKMFDIKETRQR